MSGPVTLENLPKTRYELQAAFPFAKVLCDREMKAFRLRESSKIVQEKKFIDPPTNLDCTMRSEVVVREMTSRRWAILSRFRVPMNAKFVVLRRFLKVTPTATIVQLPWEFFDIADTNRDALKVAFRAGV